MIVEYAGHAALQDLGRPGLADIGIAANGALDQFAARTANVLVGNDDRAPLVEITGSDFVVVAQADLLIAVTGACETILVDGHARPSWETLWVARGSRVVIPFPALGYRSYLAVSGGFRATSVLGSVSADGLLGVGGLIRAGDRLGVDDGWLHRSGFVPHTEWATLFRMGARKPPRRVRAEVRVTVGPDLHRIVGGKSLLEHTFRVLPQSNHIGLRLDAPPIERATTDEIVSRGVPIGAVEVPPSGGIIILLRGRLVTAGYPVVAVVTTESLDRLAQVRPRDDVRMTLCDASSARRLLRDQEAELVTLAARVRCALNSRGLPARQQLSG